MISTCAAPSTGHVHWAGQHGQTFTVTDIYWDSRQARIKSDHGTFFALLAHLIVCGEPCPPAPPVLSEAQALREMLADMEEGCDPHTAPLREELASRLAFITRRAA
ncbi:hypothetical protein [Planotetraspora sp. GP83]|uniref:hypothetical protein n=1 Tax=Planotetraspora sp. GP83 TaxID=3156264 RepID=UPI00351687A9